jgi:hypothetical protein
LNGNCKNWRPVRLLNHRMIFRKMKNGKPLPGGSLAGESPGSESLEILQFSLSSPYDRE